MFLSVYLLGSKALSSFASRNGNETLIVNHVLLYIEIILKERTCES